jgi:uncharacterized protein
MAQAKTAHSLEIKKAIIPILNRHNVARAGLFGSYARGTMGKDSDVDILISFKGKKTLLDLIGLKQELEDRLRRKVDVLTYKSIHPLLKNRILGEEVRIL